jgi:hypothetical protein
MVCGRRRHHRNDLSGTFAKLNQYLIWQGGMQDDFELKVTFRVLSTNSPLVNSGFQFLSRQLPNGDLAGYQVDNNYLQPWKARFGRRLGAHQPPLKVVGKITPKLPAAGTGRAAQRARRQIRKRVFRSGAGPEPAEIVECARRGALRLFTPPGPLRIGNFLCQKPVLTTS